MIVNIQKSNERNYRPRFNGAWLRLQGLELDLLCVCVRFSLEVANYVRVDPGNHDEIYYETCLPENACVHYVSTISMFLRSPNWFAMNGVVLKVSMSLMLALINCSLL